MKIKEVIVYHEVDDEGNHYYYFYDGNKRVDLDWGETGLVPNAGDRFSHPSKDEDLRLGEIKNSF
ncbi:MAG: hypothetical protein DRO67_03235 [Candidatus Asgardarchaeum californiense]|nr:MAG: hypothetical protein DRO67_03235 [Candidatus Asgardarchaeum californiense]